MTTDTNLDLIGDVHGCFDALVVLLSELGYRETGGAWRHPSRRAVFVGDLIDTGTGQREVLPLVRSMHDAGTALVCMGNHEWNAIGWATRRRREPDEFLRSRSAQHRLQHRAFLDQLGEDSSMHREAVDWFRSLPLWLDLAGLRVVHACWHRGAIDTVFAVTGGINGVTDDLLELGHTKAPEHTPWDGQRIMTAYDAVETLLKGIEVRLPDGTSFFDKNGHERFDARIQWWRPGLRTYRNAALVDGDATRESLPTDALPAPFAVNDDHDPRPVVFGHYWYNGDLTVPTPRAVCVDYSAVRSGRLVAYRWSGEPDLDDINLVGVPGPSRTC